MSFNEIRTYQIPDQNLGSLKVKFEKLRKKAIKLGCEPPSMSVDSNPVDVESYNDITGRKTIHRHWNVQVSGEAPKFNGWKFLACLQHVRTDDGERCVLIRSIDSKFKVPEKYRKANPDCDHCKINRYRRDTYLVVHENDPTVIQLGSSCIKDFLGHGSPDDFAARATYLADVFSVCEEESIGYGHGPGFVYLNDFLMRVAALMRDRGWVPRSKADPEYGRPATADLAIFWSEGRLDKKNQPDPPYLETDKIRAEAAIAWAQSLGENGELSDYLYNVHVVSKSKALLPKTEGLAASMIAAKERVDAEKEEQNNWLSSAHVGELGKREVFENLKILSIKEIQSDFGCSVLYMFVDPNGNRLKTFSTASERFGVAGDLVNIKGTVKKFDNYRNVNETILSRCAVYVAPTPKKSKKKIKDGI